ncbi:MAG: ParB/RepB/Spo0J family partition protein [bacterium]|nr:ParB/RepB/Spo0J family partition protein [bacterium]
MTSQFFGNSVFWIEVGKVLPNPFQPRREFDEARLNDLAESIRMYGILQPLVVTRREKTTDEGGLVSEYELISGERRLRAARLAGLNQVPALIRQGAGGEKEKLELAIIENLQREDLNVVDRARAFKRLLDDFGFRHSDIASRVGKSREYVSNSLRVLTLPEYILLAVTGGKLSEGHTRPLLMLDTRPEEQETMFKEIMLKKMSVREAESAARKIAFERARRKEFPLNPEMEAIQEKFSESLGTRVRIEQDEKGGHILIDFFSADDLQSLLKRFANPASEESDQNEMPEKSLDASARQTAEENPELTGQSPLIDDRTLIEKRQQEEEDERIYSIKNFSI